MNTHMKDGPLRTLLLADSVKQGYACHHVEENHALNLCALQYLEDAIKTAYIDPRHIDSLSPPA